jgi:nitroimidazol reductase NimA-like FMN-containing flavoprotein (pyridoxamine 5'-phosphate oxidase superfamily)
MSRTEPTRHPERVTQDREALDRLLDEVPIAHVGLVVDGSPVVVPTAQARDGDRLLVHGSTGSGWMRRLEAGADACVTVTALDALVVARSGFESSYRYRSAVIFGRFASVRGEDKEGALDILVDRLIPGRLSEVRPSRPRELAATMVLALPLEEWSLKVSTGWPDDDEEDVAGAAWAGVVPVRTAYGDPMPAPDLRPGVELPASVRRLTGW